MELEFDDFFSLGILLVVLVLFVFLIYMIIKRVRSSRYHETGSASDERNLMDFGTPVKTLYTSSKILTLHKHIDITDENENIVYQSRSKLLTLHDRTKITAADGSPVADMHSKLISLHERHFIEMADGKDFTIASEFWHIAKDVIRIEELGWTINGHILQMNYYISDEKGDVIGVVGEKVLSLHDKFCIDIYQPQYEKEVVAILVTLIHMLQDRRRSASSSSSSSSSSASSN